MKNADIKAKDIMSQDVVSVSPDAKVSEVADIIRERKIHGVPVIESGILVGIITKTDFFSKGDFNLHLPSYFNMLESLQSVKRISKQRREEIEGLINATAKDIMTKGCVTVIVDAKMHDIVQILRHTYFHILPVVDFNDKVVGVVTATDVISAL